MGNAVPSSGSLRVCTVVGARPQFIKAAPVSRALAEKGIAETLVHTGQHYDARLSQVFFDELGLDEPAINLDVGSGTHGWQTSAIMERLERFVLGEPAFDLMLVYGDTNSTMAAALVASKLQLPLAHVEAGLRSYDRSMPEEINRLVTDHLSQWLFCPTEVAIANLAKEGITRGILHSGDVMLDAVRMFAAKAERELPLSEITDHAPGSYALATVHRPVNTDNPERLAGIFAGLGMLTYPVIMPLHPRTTNRIEGIHIPNNVTIERPKGYLAMLTLTRNARRVFTDSGGLQKEAYWLGVPCITLRRETEWTETLHNGWNRCVGADPSSIFDAAGSSPVGPQEPFGECLMGTASEAIAAHLRTQS